jgi:hypothetical protein
MKIGFFLILNVGDNEFVSEDDYHPGNAPQQQDETEPLADNDGDPEDQGFIKTKSVILISCISTFI